MKISLEQPNGFTTHFAPQEHKYLENSHATREHARNRFNPYVNNEGTVVAVAGDDFVVVGGDTRLSQGYSIVTRNQSKLVQLTDKTVLATSGMYADFCELKRVLMNVIKVLKAKLEIYDYKIERQPSTESVAHLISKTLYGRRFFPYYTFNLVAGLDKNGKGVVYGYDAIGSYGSDKALAQGSGAHMIIPFLDAQVSGYNNPNHHLKPKLTPQAAKKLVFEAFRSAAQRDIYTGDKLEILVITKEGVERSWEALRRD